METLLYVLGFIIGALGTSFLLYFLKTRKVLRTQHELIKILTITAFGDKIKEHLDKKDCDKKDSEPARQEPGNTAGPTE
jgi:hypothetical protein